MRTATFTLQVRPDGESLHRVLSVCHRRRVRIVSLVYARGEIRLTVSVADPDRLEVWLGNLVDVLDVVFCPPIV